MSQNNNNNIKNRVVEAITASIARIAQEYDNLCICCNNCQQSTSVVETHNHVKETEVRDYDWVSPHTQPSSKLFSLQSEEVTSSSGPSTGPVEEQTTVYFLDGDVGESVYAHDSINEVAKVDSTEDLTLGQFLARPTTIDTFVWNTTDPVGQLRSLPPWRLLMGTTAVKRKLENFAFMRAKMHIKVLLNATPFQFGDMRICYQPIDGLLTRKFRASGVSNLIPQSQLPGFHIYPAKNAGGTMELPFVYHRNWLDITNDLDVQNFGTLIYSIYAALDVAITGGPTNVTVRTIAWFTDVELMGSTGKLTLQADEYGNGAVSAPATAIANAAGYLTKVPIIGRFARATQIGANAVSKIASLFGFTNVPNIENVHPYYPMTAPQLATAEISVPYQKLTLDPKTELSIDPTPFGVKGEDQLALSFLKKQESYFGTTLWSTVTATDALIMSVRVTPDLKISEDIIGIAAAVVGKRTNMTPLSHIGCMFENWRGSLKFRFKVICSKYHKGRLKFSYDPVFDIGVNNVDTNLVYTHILDLGETDEVTITVPYHQSLGWFRTDTDSTSNNWSVTSLAPRFPADNGTISVRVYNTLEAPIASTIRILCYVTGGDDFEFANPSGGVNSAGQFILPSFFELQSEDVCEEVHFGTTVTPHPDRYGLNFGESVNSLRKLLHRMVVMDTVPLPNGVANSYNIYRKGLHRMPYTPGYCNNASWLTTANGVVTAGAKRYALNTMHPMPWTASMFLGFRGSTNFCITTNSPKVVPNDIRVTRVTDTTGITPQNRLIFRQFNTLGSASLSVKTSALDVENFSRNGLAGMAMTSAAANPSLIFSVPDCNNYNFSLTNPSFYIDGDSTDGTERQGALLSLTTANTTATDEIGYTTLVTCAGAGVDFTCIFYCCTPTVDWLFGYPVPTP